MEKTLRSHVTGLRVIAAANPSEPMVIECYDIIGRDMFGDGITVQAVRAALNTPQGKAAKEVHLRINSPGGDPFEGIAIYNVLRDAPQGIVTIVDGVAASAASIVAMAGDSRLMGQGTQMMIHNPQSGEFGDASAHRKIADTLDTVTGSMANIYAQVTMLTLPEVLAMMDAETWFDCESAVSASFATGTVPQAMMSAKDFNLLGYRRTPTALLPPTAQDPEATDPAPDEAPPVLDPTANANAARAARVLQKVKAQGGRLSTL